MSEEWYAQAKERLRDHEWTAPGYDPSSPDILIQLINIYEDQVELDVICRGKVTRVVMDLGNKGVFQYPSVLIRFGEE